jgi:hypothetical protein
MAQFSHETKQTSASNTTALTVVSLKKDTSRVNANEKGPVRFTHGTFMND